MQYWVQHIKQNHFTYDLSLDSNPDQSNEKPMLSLINCDQPCHPKGLWLIWETSFNLFQNLKTLSWQKNRSRFLNETKLFKRKDSWFRITCNFVILIFIFFLMRVIKKLTSLSEADVISASYKKHDLSNTFTLNF